MHPNDRRKAQQRVDRIAAFKVELAELEPRRLRERYPDRARHGIARGIVQIVFEEYHSQDGNLLPTPRLRGRIQTVLPREIYAPPPYHRLLQGLRPREQPPGQEPDTTPRYAVTVSWGSNCEPWIQGIENLLTSPAGLLP